MTVLHVGSAGHRMSCDWCHDPIEAGRDVAEVQTARHHDAMFVHAEPCVAAIQEAGYGDGG